MIRRYYRLHVKVLRERPWIRIRFERYDRSSIPRTPARRLGHLVFFAVFLVVLAWVLSPSAVARTPWLRPVAGRVARGYRFDAGHRFARGWHRGADFVAPPGTTVRAPCTGSVRWTGAVGATGRGVTVACGALNATLTRLGSVSVRRGAGVVAGQPVGTAGASGTVQLGARVRARRDGYLDPLRLIGSPPRPPVVVPVAPRGRSLRPRSDPAPRPAPAATPRREPTPRPGPAAAPWRSPIPSPMRHWLSIGLALLAAPLLRGLIAALARVAGPAVARVRARRATHRSKESPLAP